MSLPPRYCPNRPLPSLRYLPGKGPKDEERSDIPRFSGKPLRSSDWQGNEAYLYGIDLFNQAYLFEAHEVWEELWFESGRQGPEGCFLKALIQVAAVRLKRALSEPAPAARLADSAKKLLLGLPNHGRKGEQYMGLDLSALILQLEAGEAPHRLELDFS